MIELFCGKTKIKISPLFFALITLFLILDRNGIAVAALFFSLLHEAAHFAVMLALKLPPREINFSLAGINVQISGGAQKEKRLAVFFAGFALNYLLVLVFLLLGKTEYMLINFAIALFTSFPLHSSDGGEILKELFAEKDMDGFFKISGTGALFLILLFALFSENYLCLITIIYIAASFIRL